MPEAQFKSESMARCESAQSAGSHIGLRELLAWAWDLIKQGGATLDKEQIKAVVLEAYDKYVAPVDLPYIPNLIEPAVDRALRRALEAGIDKIFEAIGEPRFASADAGPFVGTPK